MNKALPIKKSMRCFKHLVLAVLFQCVMAVPIMAGGNYTLELPEVPLEKTISGTVTSTTGETLPGVSIVIKGTTNGTVTDFDGNYTLSVPDASNVIVFSFIGYVSQEVSIGGQSVIDVVLIEDVTKLTEVVVVGYGTQRKVDITGAVASVKAEEILKGAPLTADQAMRGRISGVSISNRSGDPGAPVSVRIRGVGTVGNNQPLWVVDGVPLVQTSNITVNTGSNTESNPLVGINPADIESIDVLKDASASAIYGVRAANGVVIVTTKRGREGKTNVIYDGYYGVQTIRKTLDVLGTSDYIALQTELGRDFSAFNGDATVDWQDEVFDTAPMQSHNVSASGGNENLNFNISAGYFKQEGIGQASSFESYSVRTNTDAKVGERLKFGESLNVSFSDRLVESEPGRAAGFNGAQNAPFIPVYDENGNYSVINATTAGAAAGTSRQVLGLNDLNSNETTVNTKRILGSIYAEVDLVKGLKYKILGGVDFILGEGRWFQNDYAFGENGNNTSELLVRNKPTQLTTNVSNTLTYTRKFREHNITVLVGHEESNFSFNLLRGQGRDFLSDDVVVLSAANGDISLTETADHSNLRGYLGRINYSYKDKYLVTANMRRDETSRFAKGLRAKNFPSFSLGWRASEEAFLAGNKLVSDLKFRFGWGEVGNQYTSGSFDYLPTLSLTSLYVLGSGQTIEPAPVPVTLANPALSWETSTQTNFGVDVSMLQGKVELTLDYFNKKSGDILVGVPVSAVSGSLLGVQSNSGSIVNKGIELSALYQNNSNKFKYSISGNLTTVNNEVTALADGTSSIISGFFGVQSHRTIVGESLGHFYGYKTDGIYQNATELAAALEDENGTPEVGDVRFVDTNGDNRITADDRTVLGSPIPDLYYGLSLTGEYQNFDISIFFQGSAGQQVFNNTRRTLEALQTTSNQSTSVLGRWTGEGTSTSIPRATVEDPNGNNRFSDRWIEDAGFMRIQNVQIGYTIPVEKLEGFGSGFVKGLRIYIGGTNLATFTNYSGYDPEVTRGFSFQKGESSLASGQDDGFAPQPRIIQFGGKVTF